MARQWQQGLNDFFEQIVRSLWDPFLRHDPSALEQLGNTNFFRKGPSNRCDEIHKAPIRCVVEVTEGIGIGNYYLGSSSIQSSSLRINIGTRDPEKK